MEIIGKFITPFGRLAANMFHYCTSSIRSADLYEATKCHTSLLILFPQCQQRSYYVLFYSKDSIYSFLLFSNSSYPVHNSCIYFGKWLAALETTLHIIPLIYTSTCSLVDASSVKVIGTRCKFIVPCSISARLF